MVEIRVLMSTWNGAKYIREQIESILNQKGIKPLLTIRDDGSTDNTVNIIKEIMKVSPNIELIEGDNIGYQASFLTLLGREYSEQFFAFADQDDVWKPNKLIHGIELIKDMGCPCLYLTSLDFVDENLNYIKTKKFRTNFSFWQEISYHNTAGCTYVFNHKLYTFAKQIRPDYYHRNYGHDYLISLVCCLFGGKIICDSNSYIFFRRHGNNASSASGSFKKKLSRQFSLFGKRKYEKSELLQSILNNFEPLLDEKTINSITNTANYRKKGKNYLSLIFSRKIKSGSILYDIFLRLLVVFRKY